MHSSLTLIVLGVIAGYIIGHLAPLDFTVSGNPIPTQKVEKVVEVDTIPLVATTTTAQ